MRKHFIFVFILLSYLSLLAQDSFQIAGTIKEAIGHQAIKDVRVRLLERQIESCNGVKRLLPLFHRDFSIIKGEVYTATDGEFHFNLAGDLVGYYALELLFPNQERQYVSLISSHTKEKHIFNLEYLPNISLSAEEEALLEMAHWTEKVQLENEKLNLALTDGNYPAQIGDCFENQKPQGTYSCTVSIPTEVYVANLISGYNSTATGPGFTGMINFDEYIAGVVQKEIGGVTNLPNALKALAVAARTFSYRRHTLSLPVNIGQSYDFAPTTSCINAADSTTQQVMLYNNAVMNPNYAARCNGNFTQHSEQGRWGAGTCGSTCATCGNVVAYLRSVVCSGHLNCLAFPNEQPCCELNISTVNALGNIYGHGVGLCQRGTQQFAGTGFNWSYCDILTHYYTNVCIANTQCAGGTSAFSVATITQPMTAGSINGGGIFNTGSPLNLSFTANNGFSFVNWTENGTVIGTNSTYSSTVTANRNIVANFTATTSQENAYYSTIKLFPNPAQNGAFFIEAHGQFEIQAIIDICGKNMTFETQKKGDIEAVQLTEKTQGVYFVKILKDNVLRAMSVIML